MKRVMEPEDLLEEALESGNNFRSPSLLQELPPTTPPHHAGHARHENLTNQERDYIAAVTSPLASQVRQRVGRQKRGSHLRGRRTRGRGRGISSSRRLPTLQAYNLGIFAMESRKDPAKSWSVCSADGIPDIISESNFNKRVFQDRAKSYVSAMCKNIDREIKTRSHLPNIFYRHVFLWWSPVLHLQQQWINEKLALEELEEDPKTMAELSQFLAVFLFSQQGNISIEKSLENFRRLGRQVMHIS